MKKVLCLSLLLASAAILWNSCATSEEKAAQMAQLSANVTNALNNRDYKIAVDRMYPMRMPARHLSTLYSLEVKGDTIVSYLPYFGRAYSVPYGGGKALNFTGIMSYYDFRQGRKDQTLIEIGVENDEDTYVYSLSIFDNGNTSIDVRSRNREQIAFSGEME